MINPKQSRRVVEKQLSTAQKALATKRQALASTNSRSHQTRFRLEIETLQQRIQEYQAFLRSNP